ncbi:MAG: sigma-54-dependent Fis family transcriptional regulator [Spirochaetales bacterium]|nr:MAG: sigma-54-dependent Fis family transcriptional regulator [Spirochaetales bacterium]
MATIMLVDDKDNIRKVMGAVLEREGFSVHCAADGRQALALALADPPDLVLSDIRMDGMSGIELFKELRSRSIAAPFLLMTAYATVPEAVEAIQTGAIHYLSKPVDYPELLRTIRRVLSESAAKVVVERSAARLLVGSSPAIRVLLDRIEAVADSDATVLLRGENGTGKELVARALHKKGRRRSGPFVAVHCASFNPNLLESELFGHEAGAFTGAARRKDGYLEAARGGVLFLDEVSEIGGELQVKLLRVLQERAFSRVGGTELVKADFRLIAATNGDLAALVHEGRFREDLYYRLDVVPIAVPPLRERFDDLRELVEHFIARVAAAEGIALPRVTDGFLSRLETHSWPGNIRELENLVERLLVVYRPDVLSEKLLEQEDSRRFPASSGAEREQRGVMEALERSCGNRLKAAALLGISRRTLYNRLERIKRANKPEPDQG